MEELGDINCGKERTRQTRDMGRRGGRGGGERGRNLSEWHQSAGLMRLAAITCISTT